MTAADLAAPVLCARCRAELCARCGAELPPAAPTGRRRRWCSDRCRWAASRAASRARAAARPVPQLTLDELLAAMNSLSPPGQRQSMLGP